MSRQSRSNERDRRSEDIKRDASESIRLSRENRESRNTPERTDVQHISGLNRYRLNDLYERSSM